MIRDENSQTPTPQPPSPEDADDAAFSAAEAADPVWTLLERARPRVSDIADGFAARVADQVRADGTVPNPVSSLPLWFGAGALAAAAAIAIFAIVTASNPFGAPEAGPSVADSPSPETTTESGEISATPAPAPEIADAASGAAPSDPIPALPPSQELIEFTAHLDELEAFEEMIAVRDVQTLDDEEIGELLF